jgi:hypothetical protein
MTADWIDLGLITDVLDVLDQHGYARSDTKHATQAILLISDLAHIYQGSQDHPSGPSINEIPPRPEPAPAGSASQPGPGPRPGRRGQDPPGCPGHRRRLPARPRRTMR